MNYDNFIKETTTTAGTGDLTLAAVDDHGRFDALADDGDQVLYAIKDGDNREAGVGTWRTGNILERTDVQTTLVAGVYLTGSGLTPVTLTGDEAEVFNAISAAELKTYVNPPAAGGSPFADLEFSENLSHVDADLRGTAAAIATQVNLSRVGETGIVGATASGQFVGGGLGYQRAYARGAVVCGGTNSIVDVLADGGFLGGGENCSVRGSKGTVVGGRICRSYSGFGAVGGGFTTLVTSAAVCGTIPGGRNITVDHQNSVGLGGGSYTRADMDVVVGGSLTGGASVNNNTIRLEGLTGNIRIDGTLSSPEADSAWMFEWADGNPAKEDRVGLFVGVNPDGSISVGGRTADIIGVVAGNPATINNAAGNHWQGLFIRDEFDRQIFDDYNMWDLSGLSADTNQTFVWENVETKVMYNVMPCPTKPTGLRLSKVLYRAAIVAERRAGRREQRRLARISAEVSKEPGTTDRIRVEEAVDARDIRRSVREDPTPEFKMEKTRVKIRRVNPDFNPDTNYTPRQDRPEWDAIGLLGKLLIKTAEPITLQWVSSAKDGRAINAKRNAPAAGRYRVLEVLSETLIRVLVK